MGEEPVVSRPAIPGVGRQRTTRTTEPPAHGILSEYAAAPYELRDRALAQLRRPEFGALVGVLLVFVFFAVTAGGKGFLTLDGTASWLNVAAELGIVTLPVAMLMIAGEFDLSVGSVVGASSMVVAVGSAHYGLPIGICILAAFVLGIAVGAINGWVLRRTRLHSFIVTLAMLFMLAGASLGLSRALAGSTQVSISSGGLVDTLFASKIGPFNVSIVWWLAVAAVSAWVLARTPFGRWVFATGGNLDAARQAGVPTDRVKLKLYIFSACAAVLVGVLQAIEFGSGDATRGQDFVFKTIVAAVVGGALLSGGYGSAIGALLGAITYGIVSQGVFYTGWPTDWVQLFLGVLLLAAVLANNYFRKLALRAHSGGGPR